MKLLWGILLLGAWSLLQAAPVWQTTPDCVSRVPVAREKFRPSRKAFDAKFMVVECQVVARQPISGAIFVKDKDGNYFQHVKEWRFSGQGEIRQLRVPLTERNAHWRAVSNRARWNAQIASAIFEVGLSFWSATPQKFRARVIDWRYEGKRPEVPAGFSGIQVSEQGQVGVLQSVKFQLNREYFNPFDPAEIEVSYQWRTPEGKMGCYPAFFTGNYERFYHLTCERSRAVGLPYWELRFLPLTPGEHQIRIVAQDCTSKIYSPWQKIVVKPNSQFRGLVRTSRRNPKYFEFTNGQFFYPVGLNIHSNTDYRAESRLRITPLADGGLRDYEKYFKLCQQAGINCVEIWMASWTFALEWSSKHPDYYGVGRYNLANAAKLDELLKLAEKYQIMINLIWDNHGKFSLSATQEWEHNPYNRDTPWAAADGGMLARGSNLFTNGPYREYTKKRNRYIAARYGQCPQIFAMQLWSEVDLVMTFREGSYADHSVEKWHDEMILDYQRYTPLRHLITTHVCGSVTLNQRYIRLWESKNITHLTGDAYRHDRIPMTEQMRRQGELATFPKPCLITEFGGTSSQNAPDKLEADIHSGLWSSLFNHQAGIPFLWWHDFVLLGRRLKHYQGISRFIALLDLRQNYTAQHVKVEVNPEEFFVPHWSASRSQFWQRRFDAQVLHRPGEELIGWVYNQERMYLWQERCGNVSRHNLWYGLTVQLPVDFVMGRYEVSFWDSLSGECLYRSNVNLQNKLNLLPFEDDIVFMLRRLP